MPKGQVNIKMARDESRRLRKVPAPVNVGKSSPGGKKGSDRVPNSSPNRKSAKTGGTKSALNESVISGKEDRRSKLKRAQQQAAVGSTYGSIAHVKTPKNHTQTSFYTSD
jgi:hypothetical protein